MIRLDLSPEVSSAQILGGVGSASLWAAARAWLGVADGLRTVAFNVSTTTAWVTNERWQGSAAQQMGCQADGVIQEIRNMADNAEQAATSTITMTLAFEAARAAMVPPEKIAANHYRIAQLVLTDRLGLNAPEIADAQNEYDLMRTQNTAAIANYHREVSEATQRLCGCPQRRPSPMRISTGGREPQPTREAATAPSGSSGRIS